MVGQSLKWLLPWVISSFVIVSSYAYSQVTYPYVSGQVIFVQSPYNSSLYTNYNYRPYDTAPQRLPPYTTNQAVFVGQYYATTPQTITSYPSYYADSLPYTENRYTSPAAYPTTTILAYPYATVGGIVSSPYTTTTQSAAYRYPYIPKDYESTYTYPYTTSINTNAYPTTVIEQVPGTHNPIGQTISSSSIQQLAPAYSANIFEQGHSSTTYNAYPITTDVRYPYPITSSVEPQTIVQPIAPPPLPPR